jgi:hypothetical protein
MEINDLSSNNVGRCNGCGMWHLESMDNGDRRHHLPGPQGARKTCGYVFAVAFTEKEVASAKSIFSRSLRARGRDDKFKFDDDGTVSLICILAQNLTIYYTKPFHILYSQLTNMMVDTDPFRYPLEMTYMSEPCGIMFFFAQC